MRILIFLASILIALEPVVDAKQWHPRHSQKNTEIDTEVVTESETRDYFHKGTKADKAKIKYIITTLATYSWASLLFEQEELDRAGDSVDYLHPLCFLHIIFSNASLNNGLHVIRQRPLSKIWREFVKEVFDSLHREAKANNIKKEYIRDFAESLGIEPRLIQSALLNEEWSKFMDIMMEALPRTGDINKYDM